MSGRALSEAEIQARLPVWDAIADLYLDNVVDERVVDYIARTLAASPFSVDELEAIHRYEVAPVVHPNLKIVAGEWAGWGEEWLRDNVVPHVARSGRFSRWWADTRLGRWWMTGDTAADWQRVIRSVVEKRARGEPAAAPVS
jgi:hypothetical protein